MEWVSCISLDACTDWCMVYSLALCINRASAWAWVLTFVLLTNSIRGAVSINCTFRTTTLIRIAKVVWGTRTWTHIVTFFADSITSTWWRCARCGFFSRCKLLQATWYKRIANVTWRAHTVWCMTDYPALRCGTTSSNTWISTFIVYASHMIRTFAVTCAFRSTIRRCSVELWHARTRWRVIDCATNWIWSAWRWYAGIYLWRWYKSWKEQINIVSSLNYVNLKLYYYVLIIGKLSRQLTFHNASRKWISGKTVWTWADRVVVYNLAQGANTTGSIARIDTFIIVTSFC